MPSSRLIRFCTGLSTLFLLTYCSGGGGGGASSQGGSATSGTSASGGASVTGGTTSGGRESGGTSGGSTGGTTSGSTSGSGGSSPTGGASSGGSKATGGSSGAGGATAAGGNSSAGGTKAGGGTSGGVGGAGGATSGGGTSASGGATSSGGSSGGTSSTGGNQADSAGVPLAKAGDSTTTSRKYLNLGDMRLINNRWGSDATGCNNTVQKVYVNSDGTLGYDFSRATCDSKHAHPDFPEVEFGVAPFGTGSSLLTSPSFSSTTLLPIQIKNLTSATLSVNNFTSTYQNPGYYDTNFEFWISKNDPTKNADGGVYAEIISFLGWNANRMSSSAGGWSCDKSGNVTAGDSGYNLCHQSDTWSSGWRFFNFNLNNGPVNTFSGKVDVKAMLDWVMKTYSGFTSDMWLTRIEVGTEVDDNTQGSAKINGLTFEINGTSKSVQLAQ